MDSKKTMAVEKTEELAETASLIARHLKRASLAPAVPRLIALIIDFQAIFLVLWFADFIAIQSDPVALGSWSICALASAVVVSASLWMGNYRLEVLGKAVMSCLGTGTLTLFVAGAGMVTGLWQNVGVTFVLWVFVFLFVFFLPARILIWAMARWVLDFGLTERRAVLVGGASNAAELIRGLARTPGNDIRVCGIFDDRGDERSPPVVMGVPKIGKAADLITFARSAEIDMLIITFPIGAEDRIRDILSIASVLPLDVRLSAFSKGYDFPRRTSISGLINLISSPMTSGMRFSKRVMDVLLVLPALLLLSPVMALTALAIRMESKGPVLFRQMRHGYNHRPIEVLKFRSMYTDQCDPKARNIVIRDDPRVTHVGRFIRKWSIDELPQLFNVLKGDLSLVGPRPHAVDAVSSRQTAFEEIVSGYAARHKVPPGVTGWAQINGWRGEVDEPEKLLKRVEHDLYYIENRSVWMDLLILARTPLCLLNTRNAY